MKPKALKVEDLVVGVLNCPFTKDHIKVEILCNWIRQGLTKIKEKHHET